MGESSAISDRSGNSKKQDKHTESPLLQAKIQLDRNPKLAQSPAIQDHKQNSKPNTEIAADNIVSDALKPLCASVTGFFGRNAALALSGKFLVDTQTIKLNLKKAGPLGEQIADSIGSMERNGWRVEHANILDLRSRIWNTTPEGQLNLKSLKFNWEGGSAFEERGVIEINVLRQVLRSMVRQAPDASKYAAAIAAHEASHVHDHILRRGPGATDGLGRAIEEQQILAKRFLATEARANLVGQAAMWQHMGGGDRLWDCFPKLVQDGDIYKCVYNDAYKRPWPVLNSLSADEARQFVNDYFLKSFGANLVDSKTGRIRDFNFDAGLTKQIGTLKDDAQMAEQLDGFAKNIYNNRSSSVIRFLSNSGIARNLTRVGHFAGFAGMAFMCADVAGGFKKSTACGIGKLGRVGLDTVLFEAGAAVGALSLNPVVSVGCAFALPGAVDYFAGDKFESACSSLASQWFKK